MFSCFPVEAACYYRNQLIGILVRWGNGDYRAEFICPYPWPIDIEAVTETLGKLLLQEEILALYNHEWKCESRNIEGQDFLVIFVK